MLVLERRPGETVNIGLDIKVKVLKVRGSDRVILGFDAPPGIAIHRDDIYDKDAKDDGLETESRCQQQAGAKESPGTVRVS